tara:strand:+ start:1166 stop:2212 length:1047 start_codon:yes stop_codon:yes gene_type:complete
MADKQPAPQVPAGLQPIPALGGSVDEAQEALLSLLDPEEEKPESEEAQPAEVEESQPEEEDESLEAEPEEEEESDEDEEESEEPTEGEEELFVVKVDGEDREVTLEELRNGYSRQSDYTRKTQQLAGERQQMAQLQQQWQQEMIAAHGERQQYIDSLGQIVQQSMGGLEEYANVDWETLKEDDPILYVTKRDEFREAQDRVADMQDRQEYAMQQQNAEMQQAMAYRNQQERAHLVQKVPEWKDKEQREEMVSTLRTYAQEQGFSREEITNLIDHRSLIVLMKAQKYDAIQNSDVKSKKLKNKPKVVRSGKGVAKEANSKATRKAKMKRLRGTGHIDDASVLLEDFIDI